MQVILHRQCGYSSKSKNPGIVAERLAHVPQSIYLSDNDIESNIAYGISSSDINRSRMLLAAQQASIDIS